MENCILPLDNLSAFGKTNCVSSYSDAYEWTWKGEYSSSDESFSGGESSSTLESSTR